MSRLVLRILVALVAGVNACPGAGAAAALLSSVASPQQGKILYQASFNKTGTKGWTSSATGAASKSGSTMRVAPSTTYVEVLAPYVPRGIHDYSVQATIKTVGSALGPNSGFGVVVRGGLQGSQGIQGGEFVSTNGPPSEPGLRWLVPSAPPQASESVAGATVTLKTGYNTFRLDVHGSDYTLTVDSRQIVAFTINDAGTSQKVGIWALDQGVKVKSLQVVKLASVSPLPAAPPVKALDLTATDVPSSFQWFGAHYYTNAELSRLNDVATLDGFQLGYETNYGARILPSAGEFDVDSLVYADTTPQVAQGYTAVNWNNSETQASSLPGYQAVDVAGLGDVAHEMSFDVQEIGGGSSGFTATQVDIFFTRGSYQITLLDNFVAGSMPRGDMIAQATALAKVLDARIKQAGSVRQRVAPQTRSSRNRTRSQHSHYQVPGRAQESVAVPFGPEGEFHRLQENAPPRSPFQ